MVRPACWVSLITLLLSRYHCGRSQIAAKLKAAQLNDVVYWSRTVTMQAARLPALHRGGVLLQSAWGSAPGPPHCVAKRPPTGSMLG